MYFSFELMGNYVRRSGIVRELYGSNETDYEGMQ